jgi:hypothetical protein
MRPTRKEYGALLGLWLDESCYEWMFARFLKGGEVTVYEVPESECFSTLCKMMAANARSRLAGAAERQLVIWKEDSWHVESS